MRKIILTAMLAMTVAAPTFAKPQKAKITEAAARRTALSVVTDGVIKSSELETEQGKLIYSFDITKPNAAGVEEVHVGAMTGKIIGHKHETALKESQESLAESKESIAKSNEATAVAKAAKNVKPSKLK
jgi:Peptidase propeptide and YPEB domain